jgi:hypothetical protein
MNLKYLIFFADIIYIKLSIKKLHHKCQLINMLKAAVTITYKKTTTIYNNFDGFISKQYFTG